jgi:hypothetical protein
LGEIQSGVLVSIHQICKTWQLETMRIFYRSELRLNA